MKQPILIYLLFTLFLGLKLTGQIGWSWVWVFAPLWGYALLTLAAGFVWGFRVAYKAHRKPREIDVTNLSSTEKEWIRGVPDKTSRSPFSQRKH